MEVKPFRSTLAGSTAPSSLPLWKTWRPASGSKSKVHLCHPGGAVHAQPEQLVEPGLAVIEGGGVAFVAAEIAVVEDAGGQHLVVVFQQAPARADTGGLDIFGRGAVVVDPKFDLARRGLVAKFDEGLAAGTDPQAPLPALAAFASCRRPRLRSRSSRPGLPCCRRSTAWFPAASSRTHRHCEAAPVAHEHRHRQSEGQCLFPHESLSSWVSRVVTEFPHRRRGPGSRRPCPHRCSVRRSCAASG